MTEEGTNTPPRRRPSGVSALTASAEELGELDKLRREVARLADRAAIEDLLAEYTAGMDGQDPDRLAGVFTDDVVVEHPGGKWVGFDEVFAGLTGAISRHFTSHHMVTNHRATIDGDIARAVCYFHSVHLDDPARPDQHADHGGWYLVEAARTAEGWRLRHLKQVSVWCAANRQPKGPVTGSMLDELRLHLR